jgi:hypothetical protein
MRHAWTSLVVACLAACANGGSANVDSGTGSDAFVNTIDAATCGTDMLPCSAIYVAPNGNDTAAGTQAAPMKTIPAAITKAAMANPPQAVFVRAGTYTAQVAMKPGVSLFGGFDETWKPNPAVVTEIDAPSPAVVFDQIMTGTSISNFTIKSDDAVGAGASSYAVVVTGSTGIELRDVTVTPGIGAAGVDGTDGTAGASGGNGSTGQPGCENSSFLCDSCSIPVGGAGGSSACGRTGGRGGAPGHENGTGAVGGDGVGYPGSGGAGGPAGAGQNGTPGAVGKDGLAGTAGTSGSGGAEVGTFNGPLYLPSGGSNGTAGGPGTGGGGGGGGGGGSVDCDSYGSSGGGGGGGGCGGGLGTAGTGGGGSFGVVAVDSQVTIRSSMVVASHGGPGGRGGRGGTGGARGAPGSGGPYGGGGEQDDGGMGGRGGFGGLGGAGGHGGGGGGGPSAAVVCVGSSTITIPQSTLVGGTGGTAGPSPGNPGATGVSTRAIGCAFF